MGIDDETFDKAFDQAYEQMEGQEVSQEEPSSSPEHQETSDTKTEDARQEKIAKEANDIVEKEFADKNLKPKKDRDTSGKFKASKKPDPEDQTDLSDQEVNAELSTEVEAQSAQPEATSSITPPAFWPADKKALFAKAPVELQEYVAQRELGLQQHVSRLTNEAERGKQIISRLNSDFETPEELQSHKARLRADGISDEIEELHRYRAWDNVIRSDVRTYALGLLRNNGLTPQDLFNVELEDSYQSDPRVDELTQQFKETQSTINELKAQRERLENEALTNKLETFKSGKDSFGQVRRQFVDMYEPQISTVVTTLRQQNPGLAQEDLLSHAYEFVMKQVRDTFGISKPLTQESRPVDASKAKQVASSSNGAPKSGVANPKPKLKGKDFNEMFEDAYGQAAQIVNVR